MIMDDRIREILDRFDGQGSSVPRADHVAVQDYVTGLLSDGSLPLPREEALELMNFLHWGSWSEGWEQGYDAERPRTAPRFSLGIPDHYTEKS